MNLPDLIERAKKACPGWEAPSSIEVLAEPDCFGVSCIYGMNVQMSDGDAAALILASIKEWMTANGWFWRTQLDAMNTETTAHRATVEISEYFQSRSAPTELEALIAALEAAQPKE